MHKLETLFKNNRAWAKKMLAADPNFFRQLSALQAPDYLWIGCSDSRVPANEIMGLRPGEVFVHRNIANVVVHTDLNCLSVIQFAVDILKIKHIIVCGHHRCSGVLAALQNDRHGLVDNWLAHIIDVRNRHAAALACVPDKNEERWDRLCELNVIEQVTHVCRTSIVREAWERGQELSVHGWIYGLKDGLLRDLGMSITRFDDLQRASSDACKGLEAK